MNIAELKLDLFRRIDNMKEDELKLVYNKLITILNNTSVYTLTRKENIAIEEALKVSEEEAHYKHDEVLKEAKKRYPNLKFR